MRRHWAINGRFMAQPLTGVQRYAIEIVKGMDRLLSLETPLTKDLDLELLIPPGTENLMKLNTIRVRAVGRGSGHAWEQVSLPIFVKGGLINLCNTGPVILRKQIVCIHDMNTRSYPDSYSLPFRLLYRIMLPRLGHVAEAVSTVSLFSAEELARYGICRSSKIFVAPNGHEHAVRWRPEHSERTKAVAARNVIVLIGSSAPHKNSKLIVGLADRLAAAGLRVAIVGVSDPRVFQTAVMPVRNAGVTCLGRLSDNEMAALLKDSMCLAFPSFVEGFGLPPLEAMSLGCPVVVSDCASLPEICGNAALYASPSDPEAWFNRFMQLHHSPSHRSCMVERGKAQARRFRWDCSAERYLRAMVESDAAPVNPTLSRQPADIH
jgi:glycosyltransferase involved in cell wall biosynthesis